MTGAAAALLVSMLMAVAASAAQAAGSGQAAGHGAAGRHAASAVARTIVRPGDSLWSVAERAAPNADARIVVQEIIQLNRLSGTVIYPGEQLRVPGN